MKVKLVLGIALPLIAASWVLKADTDSTSVTGYVIDSSCAFTKNLAKPISKGCAVACAKAGSQLAILAADGDVYWPISDKTPAAGQNTKLLPFAAQKVNVTGKIYERGGTRAIVIEKIEPLAAAR